MKKIKFILLLSLVLSVMAGTAQKSPMFVKATGAMNRDAGYTCLPNSLFSQLPSYIEACWFGDDQYEFARIADDYTVTGPVTSMRFWGVNYYSCPPGASQAFTIKFYGRNITDPSIPGTEVKSFNLTALTQPINILFGNDYQIDLTFPEPVTLLDGWVSITRTNATDGCQFGWLGNYTGNSASYDNFVGVWVTSTGHLAFCLGGEIPETPLSNWALVIGIILIGSFIIIRFRRLV